MKRIDQRPTDPTDGLRRLLTKAQDSDTRAHGVKIVGPGEGTGGWVDGELKVIGPQWAADVDQRIEVASGEVSEASERLVIAETALGEAQGRIEETAGLVSDLEEQASASAARVAGVVEDMAADRVRLDAAEQDLAALGPRVGDVEGAVSASEAQAAQAVSDAARALQEAQQAREYAEGLDPSTGDGSYSEAMQAAQQAARDALAAMERANLAVTSASGKSSVRNTTTAPQGVGTAPGDTWFRWTAFPGGTVTGQWTWDGSEWRSVTLSHQVLSSVDLGKATVGELDGLRIKAGSVDAARMTVGVGANALADPFFTDAALRERRAAASTGAWSYGSDGGRPYMALTTEVTPTQTFRYAPLGTAGLIPTVAGRQWRIEVPMYLSSGRARVNVRWYNAQGAAFLYAAAGDYVSGPGEVRVVGEVTAPSDAVGFLIDLYLPSETTGRTARVYGGASASVKSASVHIEDGAVTASKVNAEEVAGAIGQFVEVQAENVEVTDTLATRVLSAVTAQAAEAFVTDRLVVGTGDDRTVLDVLGAAVVNDLNLRGTLRGRDAILDGTLDVEQLNVTEDLAAQVVSAMEVETRRAVVTEDAILNRATVIEGITTPLIEASEGRFEDLLAGKASITDLATGNVTLTGHFRSGAEGKPGVIIPKNYTTQAGVEQLGIWLAPDGKAPSLGSEWGRTAGMWLDSASNVAGSTTDSVLFLRGQGGSGVRVMGGLSVGNSAGNGHITPAGDGNMTIHSRLGDVLLTAGKEVDIFSVETTTITSNTDVVLRSGMYGYTTLQNTDGRAYHRGTMGNPYVSLLMDSTNGRIYRTTSARRYKTDIKAFTPDPKWLDMPVVSYVDAEDTVKKRTQIGTIADEAEEYGAGALVAHGPDGEVEDYYYSREVVVLRYFLREQRDQITALTERIEALEGVA